MNDWRDAAESYRIEKRDENADIKRASARLLIVGLAIVTVAAILLLPSCDLNAHASYPEKRLS